MKHQAVIQTVQKFEISILVVISKIYSHISLSQENKIKLTALNVDFNVSMIRSQWTDLNFSILFEFLHSVNCVTGIATILLILCSKKVYVKYFALCPGLSHLPTPLNRHGCGCEIFETTSFSSLTQVSLATPNT